MTIIVSVKINDGIVMAADSAGTMSTGQVYTHANKITNLCEGCRSGQCRPAPVVSATSPSRPC
jgi:hypothetical protein